MKVLSKYFKSAFKLQASADDAAVLRTHRNKDEGKIILKQGHLELIIKNMYLVVPWDLVPGCAVSVPF